MKRTRRVTRTSTSEQGSPLGQHSVTEAGIREEAHQQGLKDGYKKGLVEGYEKGFADGCRETAKNLQESVWWDEETSRYRTTKEGHTLVTDRVFRYVQHK